jgi:anaerobic selenocysteine-containing dehydrogenase
MPEDMVTGLDNWYATLCRQCPTSEGILVRVMEGRAKKIEGNVDYPVNAGKHSARCEAGLQALYHPDRIRGPMVRTGARGSGEFDEISWTDAISRLTSQLQNLRSAESMVMVTDPVGAHLGMVVERFVSRLNGRHMPYEPLERNTLRAAVKEVFDEERMPDLDIANASYILSFGADFLSTWVSPVKYARGYGEFRQGDRERGKMVHVDSRFSMTAASADEWVYVNPGMEGVLALSIAQVIISEGLGDAAPADLLTGGDSSALDAFEPGKVAGSISEHISAERIEELAREFAGHRPSLAFGGGSAAAHSNGLFNLRAIYSLNYLVGSVGSKGGIVFNPDPTLDGIPSTAAISSFAEWRGLVSDMNGGDVQALLVRGADPWYGLPEAVGFKKATFKVPLIVSFSGFMDDTTAMADLVLPEGNYLEEWGSDVSDPGSGHEMVGFQQPVVRPFFESRGPELGTKSFPDVLQAVAQGLDIDLELPGDNFMEIVQDGARQLFERGRGMAGTQRAGDYPDFQSFWFGALQNGLWRDESARSTKRVPEPQPLPTAVEQPSFDGPDGPDTFYLAPFASASLYDGRGAPLPWLQATPDPVSTATWRTWIEINVTRAKEMGVKVGDVMKVTSPYGSIEALAYPSPAAPTNVVSIPIGQGHTAGGRFAKGRGANVLSILAPSTEGQTGSLAWSATRVKVEKTGKWIWLPRFENNVPDLPVDEHHEIIQITRTDT